MISASVVIPVGPRIDHLNEQLHALACQETALAFEVVVVDNMPEGRDIDVPDDRFRVVHAPERPNIAYAWNVGVGQASASLILFCDADDIVSSGWVDAMSCAGFHFDVFGGPIDDRPLDALLAAKSLGHRLYLPNDLGPMPWFISANIGLTSEAFRKLGGWDDTYRAAEDIDLCWRAQLAGLKLGFVPDALVDYRPRVSAREAFSQGWSWGFAEPRLFGRYRSHGMWRPRLRDAALDYAKLTLSVPLLVLSRRLRRDWARLLGLRLGRAMGSIRWKQLLL